jgi:SAM-dependent methyltransferase
MKERINCLLCGKSRGKILFIKDHYPIIRCQKCGLVFTKITSQLNYLKIYKESYFNTEKFPGEVGYRNYLADEWSNRVYFQKKLAQIQKFKKSGKLLDLGCALGFFLDEARKKDFQVTGLDVSYYATSFASKNLHLDVIEGNLEKINLATNQYSRRLNALHFDVITGFEIIEHLKNPVRGLSLINGLLKDNGYFFATTPNQGGIWTKIMGRFWFPYKPPAHLYFLNFQTLRRLVEGAGLEVVKMESDCFRYFPLFSLLERIEDHFPRLGLFSRIVQRLTKILKIEQINIPYIFGHIWLVAKKKKVNTSIISRVPADYFEKEKQNIKRKAKRIMK